MAHDEAPIRRLRADELVLTSGAITTAPAASVATTGTLIMSGSKIWVDAGAGWEIVTSS